MKDIIGSILVLIICVAYMNMNMAYPAQAQTFPRAVIIFTAIVAALWLVNAVKKYLSAKAAGATESGSIALSEMNKTIIVVLLELLLYVIVVNRLGYFTSTFLYLLITMYTLGYRNKLVLVVLPIAFVAVVGIVFGKLLYIPLPTGLLF